VFATVIKPRRIYDLDRTRLGSLERGAMLLGLLAFPRAEDERQARRVATALVGDAIEAQCAGQPERAQFWRAKSPECFALWAAERRARLKGVDTAWRHRQAVGEMALAVFHRSGADRRPDALAGRSLSELATAAVARAGMSDVKSFLSRVWRPSLPVAHLAAAVQTELCEAGQDDRGIAAYPLHDDDAHDRVIARARRHENTILCDARFSIFHDELVRLR
jgi:hypothetical protein